MYAAHRIGIGRARQVHPRAHDVGHARVQAVARLKYEPVRAAGGDVVKEHLPHAVRAVKHALAGAPERLPEPPIERENDPPVEVRPQERPLRPDHVVMLDKDFDRRLGPCQIVMHRVICKAVQDLREPRLIRSRLKQQVPTEGLDEPDMRVL